MQIAIDEQRPPPVDVAELPVERHGDRRREQVRGEDPRVLREAAEVADDLRQRGRDDRLVERREQQRDHQARVDREDPADRVAVAGRRAGEALAERHIHHATRGVGADEVHLVAVREEADVRRLRKLLRALAQRPHEPVADALVRLAGEAEALVAVRGPAHEDGAAPVREPRRTRVVAPTRARLRDAPRSSTPSAARPVASSNASIVARWKRRSEQSWR